MEQIGKELAGKVDVYGVNIGEAFDTASEQNVASMPTVIVYKGGKEAGRLSMPSKKEQILPVIEQVLKG
jgi:thioredoxin 1